MNFAAYVVVYILSLILTELLRPKTPADKTPLTKAGAVNVPLSEEGTPIPLIFGTIYTEGINTLDAHDLNIDREMERVATGLFSHTTVFKYDEFWLNHEIGICNGFTAYDGAGGSEIVKMTLKDITIFPKCKLIAQDEHSKHYYIDKRELYGSEDSGGIKGGIKLWLGKPNQPVDAGLLATRGIKSACRGVVRVKFGYPTQVEIYPQQIGDEPVLPTYYTNSTFLTGHSESLENPKFLIKRTPKPWADINTPYHNIDGGANPAVILYLLFSLYASETFTDDEIDLPSFKNAAIKLAQEGIGLSLRLDSQTSMDDIVQSISELIDARVEVSEITGKLTLRLIRDTDDVAMDIAPEDIVSVSGFGRPALTEIVNRVKLSYTLIDTSPTAPNEFATKTVTASTVATAVERTFDFSAPALGTKKAASLVASRMLKAQSNPMPRCSVVVQNPAAQLLRVGDSVRIELNPIVDTPTSVYRIGKVSKPAYGEHTTTLELIGDSYGVSFQAVNSVDIANDFSGQGGAQGYAIDAATELTGDAHTHFIAFTSTGSGATSIRYGDDYAQQHASFNSLESISAPTSASASTIPLYASTTLVNGYYADASFEGKAQFAIIYDAETNDVLEFVAFRSVGVDSNGVFGLVGCERGRFGSVPVALDIDSKVIVVASSAPMLTNTPMMLLKAANRAGEMGSEFAATQLAWTDAAVYPVDGLTAGLSAVDKVVMNFKTRNKAACSALSTLVKAVDADQALPVGCSLEYSIVRVASGVVVRTGVAYDGHEVHLNGEGVGVYRLEVVVNAGGGVFSPVASVEFEIAV